MKRKMGRPSIEPGAPKQCTGCLQAYPNTEEHFPLNGSYGGVQRLKAMCRDCYRVYKRKDERKRTGNETAGARYRRQRILRKLLLVMWRMMLQTEYERHYEREQAA